VLPKSGKVIAATFAAVLIAGAAGCHSSSTSKQAGVNATGSNGAQGSPSTQASVAATTTPTSAAATAAPAAKATATATTESGSGSGATTTTQKAPGTPTGFTRAGSYTYDLSGTADQPFGGSQTVSGTDTQTVDAPQGSRQHSKTSGQNGSQDLTLNVAKDGLHVVDVAISNPGFNEDFRPVGNAVYFPADYKVGRKWSWQAKSSDGKYTLDVTTAISGSTSISVGGKSLKALVVDSTLHITGAAFDVTAKQRDWVSTAYALVLKEHSVTHGTAYGASVSSDVTRKLRSTTPS
jgi:hypothetical protein